MKLNDICRIVTKSHIKIGAIYKKLDGAASYLVDFLKILEIKKNGEPVVISCKEDGTDKIAATPGFWSDIQLFRKVGQL